MPKDNCFVIMPFRPELHYMYLYMQQHLEKNFNLTCTRGDAKILTVPLLDKIEADIRSADIIIADCTGRNPNVFYELGMAHVLAKRVVLITSEAIDQAPTDIRCFEFIKYDLDDHRGFLEKLENALGNVVGKQFEAYYKTGVELFQKFCSEYGFRFDPVSEKEFIRVSAAKARTLPLPPLENKREVAEWVLAIFLPSPIELTIAGKMHQWIQRQADILESNAKIG
jgi:hypothetical protein